MTDLFRAAPHVRLHRGKTIVIKAGGGSIARTAGLRQLARQVSVVQALGSRVVVVHGGGPQTDALQRMLGDEPRMIDGRRVTISGPRSVNRRRLCLLVQSDPIDGNPEIFMISSFLLLFKSARPSAHALGLLSK